MGARAATLLGLYALGAIAAIGTAFLLKRTILKGERSSFLMELPPYRLPSPRSLLLRMVDRSKIFLKRAGKIILGVTVVLWVLAQFPGGPENPPPIEESVLGQMGRVIEPTIAPLGFDWRIGIGLVSSLAAREVIVGTLGTIYGIEGADEGSMELQETLQRSMDVGTAVALLVFFVFALQCMSTVAVMKRETAGWKWPILQFTYMLALAWVGAFVANALI
jgi:ferrous iron transport protein B